MDRFGATPEEWAQFSLVCGLTADLLPVVSSPIAEISPHSTMKLRGKTPSKFNRHNKIVGITDWTTKITTCEQIDVWSKNPDLGICIATRTIKALDIDISDRDISAKIAFFIAERLGVLPMRMRANSGKLLLAFALPGEYPKRTLKTKDGLIEFLANRQQFVAIGEHFDREGKPSGARYTWLPAIPDEFPVITPKQFEKCWLDLSVAFGIAASDTGSIRNPASDSPPLSDPVADYLLGNWENYGEGKEHEIRIACPFKDEHTVDNGPSETVYFRAGTRGYTGGGWSCMHAHCADRSDSEFEIATGYTASDFEEIKDDPQTKDRFGFTAVGRYAERKPVPWIIKNILPRDGLGMTYGGSGDGKTFAVLDMVFAICRGEPWNGHRVKRGRCLYICAEGAGGFTTRLRAYANKHDNFDLNTLNDHFLIIVDTPNFRTADDVRTIAAKVKELPYPIDLIVVDTLAQVTPGADENAGKDMGVALRHAELLMNSTGAVVHLIHHAGKDESRGARGWSGMKGPLAVQFQVSREGEDRLFWVDKLKDGRDGFGYKFILENITIGKDIDDDDITSCCVEYTGRSSAKKAQTKTFGFWENAVLRLLENNSRQEREAIHGLIKTDVSVEPGKSDRRRWNTERAFHSLRDKGEVKLTETIIELVGNDLSSKQF